jgi:hypothetical protein
LSRGEEEKGGEKKSGEKRAQHDEEGRRGMEEETRMSGVEDGWVV